VAVEETKDPSESNGFPETPMPMPPFPVAVVAPLLLPLREAAEDGAVDGATANGSNGLVIIGGFDISHLSTNSNPTPNKKNNGSFVFLLSDYLYINLVGDLAKIAHPAQGLLRTQHVLSSSSALIMIIEDNNRKAYEGCGEDRKTAT
jgi:hypothetical protein